MIAINKIEAEFPRQHPTDRGLANAHWPDQKDPAGIGRYCEHGWIGSGLPLALGQGITDQPGRNKDQQFLLVV